MTTESLHVIAPWIPVAPRVVIVGQSIGTQEARQGRPFIGQAGQRLRGWLRVVGLDPDEDVMWTNVCDVWHPEDASYKPTPKECKAGYERIRGEIEMVPSVKCVLLVGGPAAHMVFRGAMGEMQGRMGALKLGVDSAAGERTGTSAAVTSTPSSSAAPSTSRIVHLSGPAALAETMEAGRKKERDSNPNTLTIPAFATWHPSFYNRSASWRKRAEIEGEVLAVLKQVMDVLEEGVREVELPEPEYVEEVVIR